MKHKNKYLSGVKIKGLITNHNEKEKDLHYRDLWKNKFRDLLHNMFRVFTVSTVSDFIKENEDYKNNARFYLKLRVACTQCMENHIKTCLLGKSSNDGIDRMCAYYSYFLDEELTDYLKDREMITRNELFN